LPVFECEALYVFGAGALPVFECELLYVFVTFPEFDFDEL
jgi:hypothetical protein